MENIVGKMMKTQTKERAVCADTVNTSNVNDKETKDDIFVYN